MQLINIVAAALVASLAIAAPAQKRQTGFEGLYTLTATLPGHPIDGKNIQASGLHFYIGGDRPGSYCPTVVTQCPNATDTVLAGSSMYVMVPGGQQAFTQIGGALAFTQAHSSYQPDYLTRFGGADASGSFKGPTGETLAACPSAGSPEYFQVFYEVGSFNRTEGCVCFDATASKWEGSFGAWQYA